MNFLSVIEILFDVVNSDFIIEKLVEFLSRQGRVRDGGVVDEVTTRHWTLTTRVFRANLKWFARTRSLRHAQTFLCVSVGGGEIGSICNVFRYLYFSPKLVKAGRESGYKLQRSLV